MGPIRSCPYGNTHKEPMLGPDSKPIWAQCGMYTGLRIRTSPYGLPIIDPCGAQIPSQYGSRVGWPDTAKPI